MKMSNHLVHKANSCVNCINYYLEVLMLLQKENIKIRSVNTDDAEILMTWWNNGKVMAHAGFPNGLGLKLKEVINKIKTDENRQNYLCIIEYDNIKIGECNFRLMKNVAKIGIKICEFSYQNQGLGKKILKILIRYLFTKKRITKIILNTNIKNLRAQHVYESIGFKKVRTNIDSWVNQLGEVQSSIDYEITMESFK